MIKEEQFLELLSETCEFYYKKTEDVWYSKVKKQVDKKLKNK